MNQIDPSEAETNALESDSNKNNNIRKSDRTKTTIERLVMQPEKKSYALVSVGSEPNNYNEALTSTNRSEWISAINSELESIRENDVWDVVTGLQ